MTQRSAARQRQSGAAILMAMLTVVLVAALASAALWQQWRAVEIESAERSRAQSGWILQGALDWARLILAEDGRKGGSDNLTEPWSMPLEAARLSTFLAVDRSDAILADQTGSALLSGQMFDLQSRLNLRNLIVGDKVHGPTAAQLARLFSLLNLPNQELTLLINGMLSARQASNAPVGVAVQAPLVPQTVDQLAWVGLSSSTIIQLRPYVTLLPETTKVNLNTASDIVLRAAVAGVDAALAQQLLQKRSNKPWETLDEFAQAAGLSPKVLEIEALATQTRFFELRGTLALDGQPVHVIAITQRDGQRVRILMRERTVAPASGVASAGGTVAGAAPARP
jgi:general secretion pathway protein K